MGYLGHGAVSCFAWQQTAVSLHSDLVSCSACYPVAAGVVQLQCHSTLVTAPVFLQCGLQTGRAWSGLECTWCCWSCVQADAGQCTATAGVLAVQSTAEPAAAEIGRHMSHSRLQVIWQQQIVGSRSTECDNSCRWVCSWCHGQNNPCRMTHAAPSNFLTLNSTLLCRTGVLGLQQHGV